MRQSIWSVRLLVKEKLRRLGCKNATRSKIACFTMSHTTWIMYCKKCHFERSFTGM